MRLPALLALTTALAAAPAFADDAPKRAISLSATGQAAIAPDMAILDLQVMREAKTAREALNANSAAMAGVLAEMKAQGIADRDLQTSNFNIQPRYIYPKQRTDGTQVPPLIVGYTVSNGLTVRVRDLANLGQVLDRSVTLGVNNGGQVRFTNDDPSQALSTARANAMRAAISKAKVLTDAAGVTLGPILNITEQNRGRPRPRALASARMAASEAMPVPVAAGENSYSVTVNVTWQLSD